MVGLLPLRMSVTTTAPGDQQYHKWLHWSDHILTPLLQSQWKKPVLGTQVKGSQHVSMNDEWFEVWVDWSGVVWQLCPEGNRASSDQLEPYQDIELVTYRQRPMVMGPETCRLPQVEKTSVGLFCKESKMVIWPLRLCLAHWTQLVSGFWMKSQYPTD